MESIHYGYRTNSRPRPFLPPAEGAAPGHALRDACEELVSASLRMARFDANGEGISIPQSFVLLTLEKLGSVPIRDLIAWSGNSPATVGGILDGLESMGAVQREHGVEDRRHVLVSLTAEGHRRAARLEARRAERWATLREKLGEADAAVVARVLEAVSTEFSGRKRTGRGTGSGPSRGFPAEEDRTRATSPTERTEGLAIADGSAQGPTGRVS
jgi:DNA-binding MarR family transcriptional regulator